MKFLIVGLGSMGKRRIRNLMHLGYKDIAGFDIRLDRLKEAKEKYGIASSDVENLSKFDAVVICTPPNMHKSYVEKCIEQKTPCFVESNTFDWGISQIEKTNVLVAPSCTLRCYSSVKKMKEILDKKEIGVPWAFNAQFGQYLLQWHPWDGLNFYMSDKHMGGIWEMLQYELVYLTWLFGYPIWWKGVVDKVSDLNADIYDVCHLTMKFENKVVGHLMADVISKMFIRTCKVFCSEGVVTWEQGEGLFVYDENGKFVKPIAPTEKIAYTNYNSKIKEEPYIKEIEAFVKAVKGESKYLYSLEDERKRLHILKILRDEQECMT